MQQFTNLMQNGRSYGQLVQLNDKALVVELSDQNGGRCILPYDDLVEMICRADFEIEQQEKRPDNSQG